MKTTAFGVSCLGIVITTIIALLQIVNIDTRATSLQDSLQEAMETSLSTAMNERAYTVRDENELVADIVEGVALSLSDPRAELTVQVNEVDKTLGIVSLKVTARYPSVMNGQAAQAKAGSTVSAERTILLEQYDTTTAGKHEVRFVDPSGALFKRYLLTADSQRLPYPAYPAPPGLTFVGWQSDDRLYAPGDLNTFNQLALDRDYEFTAVVEPR